MMRDRCDVVREEKFAEEIWKMDGVVFAWHSASALWKVTALLYEQRT